MTDSRPLSERVREVADRTEKLALQWRIEGILGWKLEREHAQTLAEAAEFIREREAGWLADHGER